MATKKTKRTGREATAYLHRVGQRIREARAQRGMTRKVLAEDSGVSLRFLAQLEAGRGNPSVMVLRQIADAMSYPVDGLITEAPSRSVDEALVIQMLGRLTPDQAAEARRLLVEKFGRSAERSRRHISLIGLRGAGKSTLGKRIAEHYAIPFIELDREVEREYGGPIGDLLALHGQPGYRRYERRCLEAVLATHEHSVIETGGGLASDPEVLELLLANTHTVWLQTSPEEHMQRVIAQGDLRPMADNTEAMDDLRAILKAREPFYRQAETCLNTSNKSAAQSLRELLKLLQKQQPQWLSRAAR
jgi:XRE family aerobic/anaerobic benzoate catabolism transcriptional regulator